MKKAAILLGIFAAVGLFLQLHALSPYKLYPDTYQNLLVAQNLMHTGHLTARLGSGGMVYPQVFAWTRPLYPLLIAAVSVTLGLSLIHAAQLVGIVAGLVAVLMVYGLTASVLRSRAAALVAAGLLAISYNHAIWGGFSLTEPLEILIVALATWQLWRCRRVPSQWGARADILTGLIFALAILTRYENAILLLPAAIWAAAPVPSYKRGLTIITTSAVLVIAILMLLQPWAGGAAPVWSQLSGYLPTLLATLSTCFLALAAAIGGVTASARHRAIAGKVASIVILALAAALVVRHQLYLGLWEFATHDPLIAILAILGVSLMLRRPQHQPAASFILLSSVLLGLVYYHTNPTMDRYLAHLLPLMLIPAAYTVCTVLKVATQSPRSPRLYAVSVVVLLTSAVMIQIVVTYTGLHHQERGVWFQPGYEQIAAQQIAPTVAANDLLVTATPEPYRLYTTAAIQNVAPTSPYLSITAPAAQILVIVDDAALRQLSPTFARFASSRLAAYQVASYPNRTPFRSTTIIKRGNNPVMVYKITLGQLKCITDQPAGISGGGCH